ncbi:O-antigen ligase family protein [uncultured Aquimarina sp.]|uniref:O-antigen ligase family protein n=1 Tax=uncultured Aquimarina sp. TaxID=575652 RepID=UPI0026241829|nr:O-antigen ligase family protein [uncultured Aquimarina sp.]
MNNYKYLLGLDSEFRLNNIFIICSYLLSIFPILTFGIRTIIIIVWIFFGTLSLLKNKSFQINQDKYSKPIIIFLVISFMLLIFSLLYSKDVSEGSKRLIGMLPFAILPIIFYLNKRAFTKKRIDWIINFFCCSVIIFVLYQMLLLLFNFDIITNDLSISEIKRNNLHHLSSISQDQIQQIKIRRLRNFILKLVDSHPTYQGLWISFVVFWLISKFKSDWRQLKYKIPAILVVGMLIFWMFVISARMPILASIVAIILTWILFKGVSIRTFSSIILFSIITLFSLYTFIKPINTKVSEIVDNVFTLPTKGNDIYNFNSTNVRSGIYYCDGILVKENWLFGTGIGDMQAELSACYDEKIGAKVYKWQSYNSHNQYLFFLIGSGVLTLFSFCSFLFYSFKKLIAVRNSALFYGFMVISIVMLTENIISRSDGVLFFGLYVSLILLSSKKTK